LTTTPIPAAAPPRLAAPAAAGAAVSGAAYDEAIALTRRLKLPHIRRALAEIVPTAKAQRWDPAEVVRALLAEEAAGRDAANLRTRRSRAAFPTGKTFHIWNEDASSIPVPTQSALRTLEWVGRRENLCICGPSGTGKSHFCEALGQAAVDAGLTVAWFTIEDLGALVRRHRVDDSVSKAMTRITRTDLIIVDDIGLLPVSADAAEGFYRLVDAAYERRSLAVSSNLHPSGFDEIMPKTLATATVDRLLHHAHVVVTQGDSHRLTEATTGNGVVPLN
jgi:DNA replication protein DnaC